MAKVYGYARISTGEQIIDLQIDALLKAGVSKEDIFTDEISGAKASRPGLDKLLSTVQAGDTIIAWKLDRLGRSVLNLAELSQALAHQGVFIRTTSDGIDTSTAHGRMFYNLLAVLAEFEREIIRERVAAGMAVAKRNGVHCGRRFLMKEEHVRDAREKLKTMPAKKVARFFKISEATLYRALARYPE